MRAKSEKRRWGLMLFIIIIMVGTSFSVVFFGFSPSATKAEFNGVTFVYRGNMWLAKINGKQAAFSFLPEEVQGMNASGNLAAILNGKVEIDTTSEVNSTYREPIALAQHQMGLTLSNYNVYLRKGFTGNNTFGLPIITCADSNDKIPVVYFRRSNITRITVEQGCIIAEASKDADFIRAKDRMLYSFFGVMK